MIKFNGKLITRNISLYHQKEDATYVKRKTSLRHTGQFVINVLRKIRYAPSVRLL